MKIIQEEEFFTLFNSKAMTFNQWLDTFAKPEQRERTEQHFEDSKLYLDNIQTKLQELDYKQYILAVVADWCGDCHRGAPILEFICQSSDFLECKFVRKEDYLDLILPVCGSEKIPYVMFYTQDGFLTSNWSERSYDLYKMTTESYKEFTYEKNEAFFTAYRKKLDDKKALTYQSIADELVHEILKVNAIQGSSPRINKPITATD